MIGDDIVSDVSGAQCNGIRAIQVRTGKWRFCLLIFKLYVLLYRNEWENHFVKPDFIADNLNHAVNTVLNYN